MPTTLDTKKTMTSKDHQLFGAMDNKINAIYVRISEDDLGTADGVGDQDADGRKWAVARGWDQNIQVYEDNDISAFSGKHRPAWERLLADIRAGRVATLVARDAARFYRNQKDMVALEEAVGIDHPRCQVEVIKGGKHDYQSAPGRFQIRMMGGISQLYSEMNAENITRAFQRKRDKGEWHGGAQPYGYTDVDKKLVVVPEEAAIVREIAARALAGEGINPIARDLTARGIPTKTRNNPFWRPDTVRGILTNAAISARVCHTYAADRKRKGPGRWYMGAIVAPGEWEPIISVEDSDALRAKFGRPQPRGRRASQLLTGGIAICGKCGSRMYASHTAGGGPRNMACLRAPGGAPSKGCGGVVIRSAPVDELVADILLTALDSGKLGALVVGPDPTVHEELSDVEQRLADVSTAFGSGDLIRIEWEAARAKLQPRHAALLRQVEGMQAERGLDGIPSPLRPAWASLPLLKKRAVIQRYITDVTINPSGPGGPARNALGRVTFDPGRVVIHWRE